MVKTAFADDYSLKKGVRGMAINTFESVYREMFPFWEEITEEDKDHLYRNSRTVIYHKGTNIHNGTECSGVILIRSGSLRVYILSDEGKEITLYRLHAGDLCMLSASGVLRSITFDVHVDAEEESECYVIGGQAYSAAAEHNPHIKIFTLELTVSRFSDTMWAMQQILFMNMDKRLAIFLHNESARLESDMISLTHEQIARYIGTSREVVTRMLKYFSDEEITELYRKGIRISNKEKLIKLAMG